MQLERAPAWLLVILAILAGLTCQLLLGTSYLAATLDPLDADEGIPVAVVVEDKGPHGRDLYERLRENDGPIAWTKVDARAAMMDGLVEKRYYGALVLPANFSADLESFASQTPHPAIAYTYTNPGASTSGNLIASRGIEIALEATRTAAREEAVARSSVSTTGLGALTLDQARHVAQPLLVETTVVNPVPAHGANGLAPTYLAMAAWIGGYLGAVALERFRPTTGLAVVPRAAIVAGAALLQGAIAVVAAQAIGLSIRDGVSLALLLAAGTWMAYALVSLLLDLLGLAGILPAFAVLALGLPASGALYPVDLLPDIFRILSRIDPFTWLVEGLRTTLYAPGAGDLTRHISSLTLLALACTLATVLLALWRGRSRVVAG